MSMFSDKLSAGQGVVGTFCHLGGAAVAECLSLSGLDYVIIDTEHGPFSDESTGEMIRAIALHQAEPFVRVRDSSRAAVLHALDLGAKGIIVPNVHTVEEARSLVEYAKFFPTGNRGFAFSRSAAFGFASGLGNVQEYFSSTNSHTLLMPQCETRGSLEHIEEIAALEGIDGIFVGPYDLSVALGMPAKFQTQEFRDALSRVLRACRDNKKLAFLYVNTMDEARASFQQGYQGVAIGTDTAFLVKSIRAMLAQ
ncbi:HpcH/HpaI aldolase/citrate lyase family protein [Mailhella massiliensis]|uniref:Host specificity protein n=1 Tax=Mailhella massiliensis TaxID=1903261 RepID=A0A921AVT3_9BACT|nr:aldolase/citrate lyase family protein [Mailhella massiliensis]HJD96673.1 host specificity protein [Mailhella massiliensis]